MVIYVGNLHASAGEDDLRRAFTAYGTVASVKIIKPKRPKKHLRVYAFVDMPVDGEAIKAIDALNGKPLKGQAMKVEKARPRITTFTIDWGDRRNNRGDFRIAPTPARPLLGPFASPAFRQAIKNADWGRVHFFARGRLPGDPTIRPPKPPRPK